MPDRMPVFRCRPGHDRMYIYSAAASCQPDAGQTFKNSFSISWKTVLRPAVTDKFNMPDRMPVSRCRPKPERMYIYSAAASLNCLCTAVCQYDADPVTAGGAGRLFCHRQLDRYILSTSWKTVFRPAVTGKIYIPV